MGWLIAHGGEVLHFECVRSPQGAELIQTDDGCTVDVSGAGDRMFASHPDDNPFLTRQEDGSWLYEPDPKLYPDLKAKVLR